MTDPRLSLQPLSPQPIRTYTFAWTGWGSRLLVLAGFWAVAAAMIIAGQLNGDPGMFPCLTILILVALTVLALIVLIQGVRAFDTKVELHATGFIYHRRGAIRQVPWDEIEETRLAMIKVPNNWGELLLIYNIRVRCIDGNELNIPRDLHDVQDLGERILNESAKLLVPRLLARIDRGEVVQFGRLALSTSELRIGQTRMPWANIQAVTWDEVQIMVIPRGNLEEQFRRGRHFVMIWDVRNPYAFLMLADTLVKRSHIQGAP